MLACAFGVAEAASRCSVVSLTVGQFVKHMRLRSRDGMTAGGYHT
jgi:hypothetical protein